MSDANSMNSMRDSYNDAIVQAADVIASVTRPFWRVIRHTRWKDDFLSGIFKWGALVGKDTPCAIVPLSSSVPEVLGSIRHIILQDRQRFPIPKKLIWRGLRRAKLDGLSSFQANVASCEAISQLIGDGFTVFTDEARRYPQYATKYIEKLNKRWPGWSSRPIMSTGHLKVLCAIALLDGVSDNRGRYLTPAYRVRERRANKRMNEAYAYQRAEVRPVRKWLELRFPQYTWGDWHGHGYKGTDEVIAVLNKVNAYVERKDSAREYHDAWAQRTKVNDERLQLWKDWYAMSVRDFVA